MYVKGLAVDRKSKVSEALRIGAEILACFRECDWMRLQTFTDGYTDNILEAQIPRSRHLSAKPNKCLLSVNGRVTARLRAR